MQLRLKFILLAVVPLLVAIAAIAAVVRLEARALAEAELAAMQPVILGARQNELRHYVELARTSIIHLTARKDEAARLEALHILRQLDFGDDGYFFVYDFSGRSLMHPRQPELVGKDLWNLRDPQGTPTIQRLIARARAGGGFEEFLWQRPSTHRLEHKLGYVIGIPEWGWMIGTGIYLDDIAETRARIDREATQAIRNTMGVIVGIAVIATLLVAMGALALNISDRRDAESKLRALARQVVRSQETERSRVARELHDGVSQSLVSVKFLLESAQAQLEAVGDSAAQPVMARCIEGVNVVLRDVRRISHGLRPALLDNLGLAAALSQVLRDFALRTGIDAQIEAGPDLKMPDELGTALFRVVQEALNNVERHASASEVRVSLREDAGALLLRISDNGQGFDPERSRELEGSGLGLSSMRERIETFGGEFSISSGVQGTELCARLPASALKT
ncbi:cache domain-containing protein [Uliginosibacterium sediminicola]|uniref:Oxygen sensor histidine kinase NreB n=1 Tax=Uliginosibacterium sediminicola TaxID=2024550 RepID=A0ABU9YZM6_9RHOO